MSIEGPQSAQSLIAEEATSLIEKEAGTEESQFEDSVKVRKACDNLLYEGDSDVEDREEDFPKYVLVVEGGWEDCELNPDEEEVEDRRCLEKHMCHKMQHEAEFDGVPILEIFKVRVQLNKNFESFSSKIYGEIATFPSINDPCNPRPISYYSVTPENSLSINLNARKRFDFLPITGAEPRPPAFSGDNDVTLDFAFKTAADGKDVFECGSHHENRKLFGDAGCYAGSTTVIRDEDACGREAHGPYVAMNVAGEIASDPILIGAYYSFFNGSWATIEVKFMKKRVDNFYGLIVARPCIFNSRIRLLTVDEDSGGGEVDVESRRVIKLTRSIVAVPEYASLIIGAKLYDDHGSFICFGKTAFPAKDSGHESRFITSQHATQRLKVTVRWECRE